jgi:hypothetical protein
MLEGLRAKLRPGSKGEAVSKVDTSGQKMASQAAQLRGSSAATEGGTKIWPVGLLAAEKEPEDPTAPGKPIPHHAPDDAGVINRLFRFDIEDI